ncbi:Ig-like domain-containing protein [Phocaeicola abscessus]|uniref:Ig-like domain-containing protein n=1 Tax=Phocaeicola abscessus TaxID=555313 RepID=UPI0004B728C3|nr:Ig-like domain-containing protein [Phocaeicola abscessus]
MNLKKNYPLLVFGLIVLVYACASTGHPDGGPYDEMPPRFLSSTPRQGETGSKAKKISILFDEYVKIEKASEKVVISPPQLEQPEIKANGKKIEIELIDSLKPNATYTIDFSDAIVDNNEGNPLGNFAFTFSTGQSIDTMEVAGTVLNAEDLEPVKGISVGLHSNLNDSAFTKLPFDRISRTDSRGRFSIRGVAPGKYHIFALMDGNQNYLYDSKTEQIAFSDSIIIPSLKPDTRQDTVWVDSLTIDTIKTVGYMHYLPDDVVLRAFKAENDRQYLKNFTRDKLNHFILTFSAKADTLPTLKGLNFNAGNAFIVEATVTNDSICYWIKDSLVYNMDTLVVRMDYWATDTLDKLAPKTDTLYLANKYDRAQRERMRKIEEEKQAKERKRKEKRGEKIEAEKEFLKMKMDAPSTLDLDRNVQFSFEEPLAQIDTNAIHLQLKVDSTWHDLPFIFVADPVVPRQYQVMAEWEPDKEYQIGVDSMAFVGIYGHCSDPIKPMAMKTQPLDHYGTILLNIPDGEGGIVELLDGGGKVLRTTSVTKDGTADFYFLNPGTKFYIRMFVDRNGNGVWDTGNYERHLQPEEMYYFPKVWEMKANFEFEETWEVHALPLDRQKLDEIKKQKPEQERKVKNRNAERAKKLNRS